MESEPDVKRELQAHMNKEQIEETLMELSRDYTNKVEGYLRSLTDEQLLDAEALVVGFLPTNCNWPLYEMREIVLDLVLWRQGQRGIRTRHSPSTTVDRSRLN